MKQEGPIGNPSAKTEGVSTEQPNSTMTVTLGDKGESDGGGDTKEEKKDTSFKYYLVSSFFT
jgi:hypothetical protein